MWDRNFQMHAISSPFTKQFACFQFPRFQSCTYCETMARRHALSAISDAWAAAVSRSHAQPSCIGVVAHSLGRSACAAPDRAFIAAAIKPIATSLTSCGPATSCTIDARSEGNAEANLPGLRQQRGTATLPHGWLPAHTMAGTHLGKDPAEGVDPHSWAAGLHQPSSNERGEGSSTAVAHVSSSPGGAPTTPAGDMPLRPRLLAAVALVVAAPAEAAEAQGFGPVTGAMHLIDGLHSITGMPWWATLSVTALGG